MRFTRTVGISVATLALSLGAAPALAGPPPSTDETVSTIKNGSRIVLDDAPTCPIGQKAVWVDRPATLGYWIFDGFEWVYIEGEKAKLGWECQPRLLDVVP